MDVKNSPDYDTVRSHLGSKSDNSRENNHQVTSVSHENEKFKHTDTKKRSSRVEGTLHAKNTQFLSCKKMTDDDDDDDDDGVSNEKTPFALNFLNKKRKEIKSLSDHITLQNGGDSIDKECKKLNCFLKTNDKTKKQRTNNFTNENIPVNNTIKNCSNVDTVEETDETDSPIKQITFHKNGKNDRLTSRIFRSRDLDEPTLQKFKSFFISRRFNFDTHLNEDEVERFMLRMQRLASCQADYHHRVVGDSDESDTSLYNDILADEEENTLACALFKEVVAGVKAKYPNHNLHEKTVRWIKRAAGLHRGRLENQLREISIEATKRTSRKTRTSTRRDKVERRDKVLRSLLEAVDELELEFGPFEQTNRRRSTPPFLANEDSGDSIYQSTNAMEKIGKRKAHTEADKKVFQDTKSKVPKMRMETKEGSIELNNDVCADLLIDDPEVPLNSASVDKTLFEFDRRPKRISSQAIDLPKHRHLQPNYFSCSTKSEAYFVPHLKSLDWQAQSQNVAQVNGGKMETFNEYIDKVNNAKLGGFAESDIVHRPPKQVSFLQVTNQSYPPRSRHSNSVYANFASKLKSLLYGTARLWATCEFFYSDLDKEWYTRNDFSKDIVGVGVNSYVQLASGEWRAIRRRLRRKPRRFSRKFIASQLSLRNKHRNFVRKLQRNPMLASGTSLAYDIPSLILPGTIVTALSRRYRVIQRGVVLSFDTFRSRYFVLFENRLYGCEYCPDSEVATHGGPSILAHRNSNVLMSLTRASLNAMTKLTDINTAQQYADDLSVNTELEKALQFCPHAFQSSKHIAPTTRLSLGSRHLPLSELTNEIAEREALVTLLSLMNSATRRKEILLSTLKDMNCSAMGTMTVGNNRLTANSAFFVHLKQHYVWVKSNLEATNQTLNEGLSKLRLLYGKAYLPSDEQGTDRYKFISKVLPSKMNESVDGCLDLANQWGAQLLSESGYIAHKEVTSFQNFSKIEEVRDDRLLKVKRLLEKICKILFTVSCFENSVYDCLPAAALAAVIDDKLLPLLDLAAFDNDGIHEQIMSARESALDNLKGALQLFKTELVVASTVHHCRQTSK